MNGSSWHSCASGRECTGLASLDFFVKDVFHQQKSLFFLASVQDRKTHFW